LIQRGEYYPGKEFVMKKLCMIFLFVVLLLPISTGLFNEKSNAYEFPLDKVILGQKLMTGYDFGVIRLADDVNLRRVKLTIELNEESPYIGPASYVRMVLLNYDPDKFFENDVFSSGTILNDENNVKIGRFGGYFDLRLPATGRIGSKKTVDYTYERTILAKNMYGKAINLNPEDFAFGPNGYEDIFAAVYITGLETPINGKYSIWAADDKNSASPVPEPATMLLLGSGLVGLAGFRRRFRNN